jgi:pantoate--beta-alanine ligase
MYPPEADTWIETPRTGEPFEGRARPGHFRGVATVCAKLFEIVRPDRVYFGQKDYQQLLVIQRMVADLNMPITVVAAPTVREADGLAMSSRNAYLQPDERRAAAAVSRALFDAEALYTDGERSADALRAAMAQTLAGEPAVRVEYADIADVRTLAPLTSVSDGGVALVAVQIGPTRLIDNVLLGVTVNHAARRTA